jgi:hypothetical protein
MISSKTPASFVGSLFNMKADVYIQQNVQDKDTGAIKRQWIYNRTIQCKVEPLKMRGASVVTDNKGFAKTANSDYNEKMQLRLYCFELMSKRWRIQNIRSSDGEQIFVEIDKYDQPDTIFEVTGSHGVVDAFGKIAYYEAALLRSEVQDDSQS